MYVPQIQAIVADAVTPTARHALRLDFLRAAAGLALPASEMKSPRRQPGPSRWPRIGGADLVVRPNLSVESDEYQRRWQASDITVWIYALGCPGLQILGQRLGLPVFKIGSTTSSIQARMQELGRDGYGAIWRDDQQIVAESGFGRGLWVSEQVPVDLDLSPLSPVHPSVRGIGVRLPVGMDAPAFEHTLAAEVGMASLGKFAASAAGRKLCAARGVDPARCRRVTRYVFGSDVRDSAEEEFTIFKPRADANRLAAIAERIVVRHVMGIGR